MGSRMERGVLTSVRGAAIGALVCSLVGSGAMVAACGDGGGETPIPDGGSDAPGVDGASEGGDGEADKSVSGKVLDYVDKSAVPGAKITLVDAVGSVRSTITDPTGAFSLPDIETPYMARIDSPDPNQGNELYDHLSLRHPVFGTSNKPIPELGWAEYKVAGSCAWIVPP